MNHFKGKKLAACVAIAAAILLVGCGIVPAPEGVGDRLLVATDTGQIRGATKSSAGIDADVFLGIPFAAPPVGDLRWASAARAKAWQGVRDGTIAPPVCPQGTTGSEDCLYLNLYRPAGIRANASLPVMVYAYGGGNTGGSANRIDATRMANDSGIIVIIPNHRLGALGFLNHPAIAAQAANGQGGNYGVLDLKAALEWVQRNVAAFGGNPKKVTLASQSSGATNTCRLMVDPSTVGLFHAVMLTSDDCVRDVDSPEEAVIRATNLATKVGCTDASTMARCLRSKTPTELTAAGGQSVQGSGWNPTAAKSAIQSIIAGEWRPVPVLLGSNREEGRGSGVAFVKFTPQDYAAWVARLVGAPNTAAVLAAYPVDKYSGPYAIPYVVGDFITDSGMRGLGGCPNLTLAKALASQTPTYYFQFEDSNPLAPSSPAGYVYLASHSAEIPFVFPPDAMTPAFTAGQRLLSNEMIRYWGAFTKNHDPAVSGQAAWPRFVGKGGVMMSLRPAGASQATPVEQFEQLHRCDLWSKMPQILNRGEI